LVKDYGQQGYLRIYDPYYTTFQPKQDGERYDLKLNEPFAALQQIIDEYPEDLFTLSQKEHRLVPFLVILVRELSKWKATHDGSIPTGFQQQQEFRAQVTESAGRLPDQENYTEALNNISSVFKPRGYVPDEVQELLDSVEVLSAGRSDPFWKYVTALKQFIAEETKTPVR
jgi:NEDD8-activating enzyme E1 regulatory subunit